jgi:hypothetical protein
MDDQHVKDLEKFRTNLELIAKVLDLSSHSVRSAFGRQALFAARPELRDQFKDVMDTLNHLLSSCNNLLNPED